MICKSIGDVRLDFAGAGAADVSIEAILDTVGNWVWLNHSGYRGNPNGINSGAAGALGEIPEASQAIIDHELANYS